MPLIPAPAEVLQLATEWFNAALSRDRGFVTAHTSTLTDDWIVTIGSEPYAHYRFDDLLTHLGEVLPRMSVTSAPRGFVDGDTAWTVDFPEVDMHHDGVITARHTVVMRRVDGAWKVAHSHLSEGVKRLL